MRWPDFRDRLYSTHSIGIEPEPRRDPSRVLLTFAFGRRPLSAPRLAAVVALLISIAAVLVFVLGLFQDSERDTVSVLLVTLDTTRADRLGCYGYASAGTPHLDALAARGVRFDRAYTVAPITLPAHTSILTGTTPLYHGVRDNGSFRAASELTTLAEILRESGRRTGAFLGAFPLHREFGLDQGFEVYDDALDPIEATGRPGTERRGDRVVAAARDWLQEIEADAPFFAWVHLFDPHAPYTPPHDAAAAHPDDPYQGEIAFMDACVGELLDSLEAQGRLANTLVVVVADHGESLGEHEEESHGLLIHDGTMRVPWIIAGPDVPEGVVRTDVVRTTDLVPSLTEWLGLPAPAAVQGAPVDWTREGAPSQRAAYLETLYPRLHYGWSELRGLVHGDWKIIEAPGATEARPELYRIREDAAETVDAAAAEPARLEEMQRRLRETVERLSSRGTLSHSRELSDADRQRLRQLGYLGDESTERRADGRHPREMIALKYRLDDAKRAVEAGRFSEVERLLTEVAERDPENPGIPEIRGVMHKATAARDPESRARAIASFETALKRSSENPRLWKHLADLHAWDGNLERAVVCFGEAERRGPLPDDARLTHAHWLERLGRGEDAWRSLTGVRLIEAADADTALERGQSALDASRRAEALAWFDRAAAALSEERQTLRRLALRRAVEAALDLRLPDAAYERLTGLTAIAPEDDWAERELERLRKR